MWGLGVLTPVKLKITYNFWLLKNLTIVIPEILQEDVIFLIPPNHDQCT